MDMDNLGGITSAIGLGETDRRTLRELLDAASSVRERNLMLEQYYESERPVPSIGIDTIPDSVDPGVRCDWARKAVTSVSERVRLDGFVFEGDYEDPGFERVVQANDLDNAFNRHIASELTHGCMFATVQRSSRGTQVRLHSADTATALWDTAAGRVAAGLAIADVKRVDWSVTPVPVQVNMHLPGRVVVLKRLGAASWAAKSDPHVLDRPMMEALTYRATGTKPFGQSRITRTVRYLVDEVQRVMRYMAVSAAMYAAPMMVANGLTDEQYDEMSKKKWSLYTTSWMLATRDENGNTPSFEKIAASSPQPYIDAIATYAKLFSGATGVPLNSLGIVQDNPSSAQAIAASREDICIAAEDCINSNAVAMRNIALMAMAVEHNRTIDELSDEQKSVMPHFRNPNMPSLAASADAMTKIAGSLPGFSETREFLTGMGFDASEVESIRAQLRRRQASTILAQTIGQPSTAAGDTGSR